MAFSRPKIKGPKPPPKKAPVAKVAAKPGKVKFNMPTVTSGPKGKLQDFPINMVRFHVGMQARKGDASTPVGGLYADHVADLRAAIRGGAKLPPVQIWSVPGEGNLVADGHHTVEAARQEGLKTVSAEVHEGTILQAILAATGANPHAGAPLKMTNEEKRSAVTMTLLALRQHGESWTNARIAQHCHVGDDLVAACIMRLPADQSSETTTGPKVGKDGKNYKAGKGPKAKKTGKELVITKSDGTSTTEQFGGSVKLAAKMFDLKDFESKVGVLDRDIDNLGRLYGAIQTVEHDALRRLLREFKAEFLAWNAKLIIKSDQKEKR